MSAVNKVQCDRVSEKPPTVIQNCSKAANETRNIIILGKHSTLSRQPKQTPKQGVVMMDTAKKKSKTKELISIGTAPPPAVARRNARERNRVKQVNNGFSNLRQHIPNSIAAAFETGTGRGGNKKLSKVETLRMAVEYIRSLEELLSLSDDTPASVANSPPLTYRSSVSLPSLEVQSSARYAASLASPSSDDDNISSNSTPPPLQYIKVDAANRYHIVPMNILASNEQLKALTIQNDLLSNSVLMDPELEFKNAQLSGSDTNSSNTPLSPAIYSESSLSPGTESDIQAFIPVFNIAELSPSPPTIKVEEASESNEEMRILCRNLIMLQADTERDLGKQQLNVNELISW